MSNPIIISCVLASYQFNGPTPIKSIGLFYGSDATTVPGTGFLGSHINTLNETKNSSIELFFQYEIDFS